MIEIILFLLRLKQQVEIMMKIMVIVVLEVLEVLEVVLVLVKVVQAVKDLVKDHLLVNMMNQQTK